MSIKIKTEIEKEVNIGDTLTPEEAQKYIEAGGFVKHVVIYAMINNILNYYVDNQWLLSREPNLADVSSGIIFTAVENPEKQKKQDDKAVIKELQENCGSLTKEVEDLKSQLAITKTELVTIERNTDRLADENAELKRKSEWLPYPENKPTGDGVMLIKDSADYLSICWINLGRFFLIGTRTDVTSQVKSFKAV